MTMAKISKALQDPHQRLEIGQVEVKSWDHVCACLENK